MPISLRDIHIETDLDRVVWLINSFESDPISLEQYLRWYTDLPAGRTSRRRVAVTEQGHLVGYSMLEHQTWYAEGQYYVWVVVDAQYQQQGIGSRLYQDALDCFETSGATMLKSEVRDNDPVSQRFAEQRGFHVTRHQYESVLDLETFDETPYLGMIAALEAEDFRFFPLADYPDRDEGRRKLYDVNYETALATPGVEGKWMPLEEFLQYVCEADWFNPCGQWIAAQGDYWVGLGAIQLFPEKQSAYNLMTGVRQPYTGRKIAQALKIHGIRYARANGARSMRTNNASVNAPMLAINRKLGYVPQPGKFIIETGAQ